VFKAEADFASDYNRASREPERAPLGAKMASQCMLRLTLPCAQVAQAELRLKR
jgi:hypothetical protein